MDNVLIPQDRNQFFAGDKTFDRVPVINGTSFDFGREYTGGGGYGGGGGGGGGGGIYDDINIGIGMR